MEDHIRLAANFDDQSYEERKGDIRNQMRRKLDLQLAALEAEDLEVDRKSAVQTAASSKLEKLLKNGCKVFMT